MTVSLDCVIAATSPPLMNSPISVKGESVMDRELTESQLQLLELMSDDLWVLMRRGGISVPDFWVHSSRLDASQPVGADDVSELLGRQLIEGDGKREPIGRYRLTATGHANP